MKIALCILLEIACLTGAWFGGVAYKDYVLAEQRKEKLQGRQELTPEQERKLPLEYPTHIIFVRLALFAFAIFLPLLVFVPQDEQPKQAAKKPQAFPQRR